MAGFAPANTGPALRSALVGALALHTAGLVGFLAQPPGLSSAAWGWFLTPEESAGWGCQNWDRWNAWGLGCSATSLFCDTSALTCQVAPAEGYTCNATETVITCQKANNPTDIFLPNARKGTTGCSNSWGDALFWDPPVGCEYTGKAQESSRGWSPWFGGLQANNGAGAAKHEHAIKKSPEGVPAGKEALEKPGVEQKIRAHAPTAAGQKVPLQQDEGYVHFIQTNAGAKSATAEREL